MKNISTYVITVLLASFLTSCTSNNEEELYPSGTCDTTNITYQNTIVPIITQQCYECHGGSAEVSGIPLEGHQNIKAIVDAGRLVGAINHQVGFSPMPKDRPKLNECDIMKIETWVNAGAPNN